MGEKRKPEYIILLKNRGKGQTWKIELFPGDLWPEHCRPGFDNIRGQFRVRVNGVWYPRGKKRFFTKTRIKEMVFHGVGLSPLLRRKQKSERGGEDAQD